MAKNPTVVLLLLVALLYHVPTGEAQKQELITEVCFKSSITFTVTPTGNVVSGQKEYVVAIGTTCGCPMKGVRVWCGGLETSAVPLDPGQVEVDEGMCVLKVAITKASPVVIKYSSQVPVNFRVFNANTAC